MARSLMSGTLLYGYNNMLSGVTFNIYFMSTKLYEIYMYILILSIKSKNTPLDKWQVVLNLPNASSIYIYIYIYIYTYIYPHVVIPNHKIISLLIHKYNFNFISVILLLLWIIM
jgi:hypothetical protein